MPILANINCIPDISRVPLDIIKYMAFGHMHKNMDNVHYIYIYKKKNIYTSRKYVMLNSSRKFIDEIRNEK